MLLVIEARYDTVSSNIAIGTWNFRSMNQGKLEVVKQEMARVFSRVRLFVTLWTVAYQAPSSVGFSR